jgi:hypothetical protein
MAGQASGEDFQGVIGRTYADSQPWWPPAKFKRVRAENARQ